MASFSVPCSKTSALFGASHPNPKLNQHGRASVSFSISSRPGSSLNNTTFLGFQASNRNQNQYDVLRASDHLNEVAVAKSSNSVPVPETNSDESDKKVASEKTIPDASAISAFMNQVSDLVKLVDSRDIVELQLKQLDCEVLLRKKEALPQPPVTSPYVMMQSPSPQDMVPSQLPPPQAATRASSSPSPAAVTAPPTPAKPKSSHPPLKCPMAGTFYRCAAPGAPPFVKVGDKVQKGQVICIIEAMKLMNEIEADQSGTVVDILVEDGKPVSVDMPLFVIEP